MRVRFLALLAALSLLVLAALPASASTSNPKFNPPKSFYLALGDSLAFGYQQSKFIANLPTENPSAFVTGYVDDFAGMLQGINPAIETVNLGCPDETTSSFMAGGCPYTALGFRLHRAYGGAQLDAAISFLKSHPGQVSPITIDLGANDANSCGADQTCFAGAICYGAPEHGRDPLDASSRGARCRDHRHGVLQPICGPGPRYQRGCGIIELCPGRRCRSGQGANSRCLHSLQPGFRRAGHALRSHAFLYVTA